MWPTIGATPEGMPDRKIFMLAIIFPQCHLFSSKGEAADC